MICSFIKILKEIRNIYHEKLWMQYLYIILRLLPMLIISNDCENKNIINKILSNFILSHWIDTYRDFLESYYAYEIFSIAISLYLGLFSVVIMRIDVKKYKSDGLSINKKYEINSSYNIFISNFLYISVILIILFPQNIIEINVSYIICKNINPRVK